MTKRSLSAFMVIVTAVSLPPAVRADEVVHFSNGAEMTVRAHTVDKEMVKLDLGSNNFIAFPMSMVDKIVSAGQNVFLNPTFHPANQAVAGGSGGGSGASSRSTEVNMAGASPFGDNTIRGSGAPTGYTPQPNARGGAGVMLGEAADEVVMPPTDPNDTVTVVRQRTYNPALPVVPGGMPQVINPPERKGIGRMTIVAPPRSPNPGNPTVVPNGPATPPTPNNPSPQDQPNNN